MDGRDGIVLPENIVEVKRIKRQAAEYLVLDGVLYKRGKTHLFFI